MLLSQPKTPDCRPTIYRRTARAVRAVQTVRLADFILKKTMHVSSTADSAAMAWSPVPVTPPRPLDLALSPTSLRAIASAEVAFDELAHGHEVSDVWEGARVWCALVVPRLDGARLGAVCAKLRLLSGKQGVIWCKDVPRR